jgi:hypothetical protein
MIKMFNGPARILIELIFASIFGSQLSAWSPNGGNRDDKFPSALAFPPGPISLDRSSCLPLRRGSAPRIRLMLAQVLIALVLMAVIYGLFTFVVRQG